MKEMTQEDWDRIDKEIKEQSKIYSIIWNQLKKLYSGRQLKKKYIEECDKYDRDEISKEEILDRKDK